MLTFELMMDKVRRNLVMLHKSGDEEMPRERKLALIKESLGMVLDRGDLEQRKLDGINAGTLTFESQAQAIGQYNRCLSLVEVCRDTAIELIRQRELIEGRSPQPALPTTTPPINPSGKFQVPCKICGKPVFLDPIPPKIAGPLGEPMRELLMKFTQYVVHEGCVGEAHRKAKQRFARTP